MPEWECSLCNPPCEVAAQSRSQEPSFCLRSPLRIPRLVSYHRTRLSQQDDRSYNGAPFKFWCYNCEIPCYTNSNPRACPFNIKLSVECYWRHNFLLIAGCSKKKLDNVAPARDLYQGNLFRSSFRYATLLGLQVNILSAKLGLIGSSDRIEPYDQRIQTQGDILRLRESVLGPFAKVIQNFNKIIIIAGEKYRAVLEPIIQQTPSKFDIIFDSRGLRGMKIQVANRREEITRVIYQKNLEEIPLVKRGIALLHKLRRSLEPHTNEMIAVDIIENYLSTCYLDAYPSFALCAPEQILINLDIICIHSSPLNASFAEFARWLRAKMYLISGLTGKMSESIDQFEIKKKAVKHLLAKKFIDMGGNPYLAGTDNLTFQFKLWCLQIFQPTLITGC